MKNIFASLSKSIRQVGMASFLVSVAVLSLVAVSSALGSPTQAPPNGNVSPPINTSATGQTKVGSLSVYSLYANNTEGGGGIGVTGKGMLFGVYGEGVGAGVAGYGTLTDFYLYGSGEIRSVVDADMTIISQYSGVVIEAGHLGANIGTNPITLKGTPIMIESGQDRTPSLRFNGPWSVENPTESYAMIRSVNDNGGPGANAQGSLRFFTSSGDPASLTEKMTILGTGSVGIGTASPGQKLTVAGVIESTSGGIKFPDGTTQTTAATGGGGVKTFIGGTTGTYIGSDVGGYDGGDAKCAAQYGAGARMCAAGDFANGRPTASGWYNTFVHAGYYETNGLSDCMSWTSGLYERLGMVWLSQPSPSNCSYAHQILCCK